MIKRISLVLFTVFSIVSVKADLLGPYSPRFYFSTYGDDCYADGELALTGECYALVWKRNGAEFCGFNATGTYGEEENATLPVDSENCRVLNVWPAAVKEWVDADPEYGIDEGYWTSYCPGASNVVSRQFYLDHTNGTYSIYLFDTRKLVDGKWVVSGCDEKTKTLPMLNAYGIVYGLNSIDMIPGSDNWSIFDDKVYFDPDAVPEYGDVLLFDEEGFPLVLINSYARLESEIPADAPQPCVSEFVRGDGVVTLSVTNTASYLRYNVTGAGELGELQSTTNLVGTAKQGGGVLTWTIPAPGAKGFYKVVRQPLVEPER